MRILHYVKHRCAIRLKFGGTFLTSLTKLVLEEEFGICSLIKKGLFLDCCRFSAFVIVVINTYVLITRFVPQRNTACNRNHELYHCAITLSK